MNLSSILLLATATATTSDDRDATLNRLATSAESRLEQALADLSTQREQIAAEKLPLAQELTALEEKLAGLRKEHDRATRSIKDHMNIIEALERRDTERAERLVRQHSLDLATHVEKHVTYLD